jgi:SAM-dependent methyltransferase
MDLSKYNQKTPDINEGRPDRVKGELLKCKEGIIARLMDSIHGISISELLNVGPAAGWEVKKLSRLFELVIPLTLFEEEAKAIFENTGIEATVGDMHDMRDYWTSKFDIVFASHVLEHSHSPYIALSEFFRVLIPSGWAFIVLPNANGYTALHTEKPKRLGSFPAHLFCPSIETMIEMAKHVGFTFEAYHEEPQWCEGQIHYINQIYIFRK